MWRKKIIPPEMVLDMIEPGMSIFLGTGERSNVIGDNGTNGDLVGLGGMIN